MLQRRRAPLNAQEVAVLTHLANGNALNLKRKADRAPRLASVSTQLYSVSTTVETQPGSLKILMLPDVYFPRVNGVSTSIASFRSSLERLGHSVSLICPDYSVGQVDEPGGGCVSARAQCPEIRKIV